MHWFPVCHGLKCSNTLLTHPPNQYLLTFLRHLILMGIVESILFMAVLHQQQIHPNWPTDFFLSLNLILCRLAWALRELSGVPVSMG